jgi:hypothetical protein
MVGAGRGRDVLGLEVGLVAEAECCGAFADGGGQVVDDFGVAAWGGGYSLEDLEKRFDLGKMCAYFVLETFRV